MWNIDFISENDLKEHVRKTIKKYGSKLESYDLNKFNSNIIDPIKMIFDKHVYHSTWDQIIKNEIFRQRDKSNNNDIGYFHQNFFSYINGCTVPDTGWDVVFSKESGIYLNEFENVKTIYVEMKNKHNTMNSSSASKTYIKMQNQLLQDDDCVCFLVEAIAKKSQNIKWETTIDNKKVGHKRIRRVSMDKFYSLVTGEADAFHQICMVLPSIIKSVIEEEGDNLVPKDTVMTDIIQKYCGQKEKVDDLTMTMAMYMLGFSSYNGF